MSMADSFAETIAIVVEPSGGALAPHLHQVGPVFPVRVTLLSITISDDKGESHRLAQPIAWGDTGQRQIGFHPREIQCTLSCKHHQIDGVGHPLDLATWARLDGLCARIACLRARE
jgi:hypothetical protein